MLTRDEAVEGVGRMRVRYAGRAGNLVGILKAYRLDKDSVTIAGDAPLVEAVVPRADVEVVR